MSPNNRFIPATSTNPYISDKDVFDETKSPTLQTKKSLVKRVPSSNANLQPADLNPDDHR